MPAVAVLAKLGHLPLPLHLDVQQALIKMSGCLGQALVELIKLHAQGCSLDPGLITLFTEAFDLVHIGQIRSSWFLIGRNRLTGRTVRNPAFQFIG
jgi:hypothetical protein